MNDKSAEPLAEREGHLLLCTSTMRQTLVNLDFLMARPQPSLDVEKFYERFYAMRDRLDTLYTMIRNSDYDHTRSPVPF